MKPESPAIVTALTRSQVDPTLFAFSSVGKGGSAGRSYAWHGGRVSQDRPFFIPNVRSMQNIEKQGVLIIRVSDAKQEREGLSLDNQEQTLRAYAEDAGIRIVREFRFQESADLKIRLRFREVIA